jgi:hypothetical protein
MGKLWEEIKYCMGQIRGDYPRQREIADYWTLVAPMMSLELKPYTLVDCITTAITCRVPSSRVGDVAYSMYARSNRGTVDMSVIRDILTRLGDRTWGKCA